MQVWIGNDEFCYCHWIAASEQDIYKQLDEWNLEGKILKTHLEECVKSSLKGEKGFETKVEEIIKVLKR